MTKSDGGKGSSPRPYSVTQQEYDSRWDAIFGIKNNPKTLADNVWNDKMKEYQVDVEKKLIKGNNK